MDAVKKWSGRRNQLVYAQRKAVEGTDKALNTLATFAAKKPAHSAVLVQARAMSASVAQYRDAQRRRVELVESGDGNALHLRATPPGRGLVEMSVDERAVMIAAAIDRSDKALEVFNTALKALRAKIRTVDGTEAARKRLRVLADKAHKAVAAEAKTDKRLLAHIAKGDERLFRHRRDTERCSGPALVLFEGCTISDGVLRLPGGTEIPLPAGVVTIDDALAFHQQQGLVWGGAVHVVDVTDTAGKVTRRTGAEHRKYHVHFLCRAEAPAPRPVTSPSQSLGTDWGVVVPLVCSDGSAYSRYASDAQQHANHKRHLEAKQLQQSMANKVEGSRRHTKQHRQHNKRLAKNTDVRVNHQLHVAKAVVTTPEVRKVVLEDTNATNMTASAEGTKTFPTRGSSAKRGLNRSLAETAPARQMTFIERAAVIASVATERVNPAYTSLTCFVCGTLGQRETQALFWCPECDLLRLRDTRATRDPSVVLVPGVRLVHPRGCASHPQRERGRQPWAVSLSSGCHLRRQGQPSQDARRRCGGLFGLDQRRWKRHKQICPQRPSWSLRYISPIDWTHILSEWLKSSITQAGKAGLRIASWGDICSWFRAAFSIRATGQLRLPAALLDTYVSRCSNSRTSTSGAQDGFFARIR